MRVCARPFYARGVLSIYNDEGEEVVKMRRLTRIAAFVLVCSGASTTSAQTPVPVPRPFPGSGAPVAQPTSPAAPATPPAAPAAGQAPRNQPAPAVTPAASSAPNLGDVPIYPSAEFLETLDAGSGQRYHLYGTNLPYADAVAYYRTVLKNGGREIYRSPGMHQFDLGRFQEDRMAYPPSVVIKDYAGAGSKGYLSGAGTSEQRYMTVIQIVAP
jgi:hypothetical protein